MTQLKGHIERVTFSSEESSYCVCKLKIKDQKELITIVGNIINPVPGEYIEVSGEWISHSKFGNQLKIKQYKTLAPATQLGIQKYLGSGLIKGIGPVMAKRIVKHFGIKSIDIIDKEIQKLSEIDGIGKKRIYMIQSAWDEQKEVRSVMLFLQSHGVSTTYAAKIYKMYGQESIHVVKENPYRLARDVFGIGFLSADKIAQNLGVKKDSSNRIEAGLEYILHQLSDKGHVCYPIIKLTEKIIEILEVNENLVNKAISDSFRAGRIVIENASDPVDNVVENQKLVFLKKFHLCEIGIASNFSRLKNANKSVRLIDSSKAMEWVKGQIKIKLA